MQEEIESQKRIDDYLSKNEELSCITLKDVDELPFKQKRMIQVNTYNSLINNLEELELNRFRENIDTYLDMIASGKKLHLMQYTNLQEVNLFQKTTSNKRMF